MASHGSFEELIIIQLEGIDRFYSFGIRELCDKLDAFPWLYVTLRNMEHPRYSPGQWLIDQIRNLNCAPLNYFPEKIHGLKGSLTLKEKSYKYAYTNPSFWKEKYWENCFNDIINSFINGDASESRLWYHGTSASSAYSILHHIQRIDRDVPDFGSTPGFYLGNSLSRAVEWSKIKTPYNQYGAVIVFNISDDSLDQYNYRKFCDLEQWKNLISHSRRRKRCSWDNQNSNLINEVDGQDFVSGFVCVNPRYICQS